MDCEAALSSFSSAKISRHPKVSWSNSPMMLKQSARPAILHCATPSQQVICHMSIFCAAASPLPGHLKISLDLGFPLRVFAYSRKMESHSQHRQMRFCSSSSLLDLSSSAHPAGGRAPPNTDLKKKESCSADELLPSVIILSHPVSIRQHLSKYQPCWWWDLTGKLRDRIDLGMSVLCTWSSLRFTAEWI